MEAIDKQSMNPPELIVGDEARQAMIRGINKLGDAVRVTLGPKGRFVMLSKDGSPLITNDGVTVARDIVLEDRYEDLGAILARDVSSRVSRIVGDGTSTAVILAQAIASDGLRMIAAGANPVAVRRGIQGAERVAVARIREIAQHLHGEEELASVATISSRDPEIGTIVARAQTAVGDDGIINVETSGRIELTLELKEGTSFERGYLDAHMVTDKASQTAVLNQPYILMTDRKVSNIHELVPLFNAVIDAHGSLLVISDDIAAEALQDIVINASRGTLQCVCVKAPRFGSQRANLLRDLAAMCGGEFLSRDLGSGFSDASLASLGRAERVVVSADDTTIFEGWGREEDVHERIDHVKRILEATSSNYDREMLVERLNQLTRGVANILVGAATEAEANELKLRIDDAIRAVQAVAKEGIVAGGGVAYLEASRAVALHSLGLEGDEQAGSEIVRQALCAPLVQIANNAGVSGEGVLEHLISHSDPRYGFDAAAGVYCDLVEAGIIDPALVCISAIECATSIASLVLTSEVSVLKGPKKRRPQPQGGDDALDGLF